MSLLDVRLVDAILVLVALEGVGLAWWRLRRGRGPSVAQTVSFLSAGAALLLAVRGALAAWPPWTVLAALAVAGLAHAAHVALDGAAPRPTRDEGGGR